MPADMRYEAWTEVAGVRFPTKFFESQGRMHGKLVRSSKESWGWFCVADVPGSGEKPTYNPGSLATHLHKAIRNGPALQIPVFVLAGIKDTNSLLRRIRKMVELANSPQVFPTLLEARADMDDALGRVIKERRVYLHEPFGERMVYRGKPAPLRSGTTVNPKRFGKNVIVRVIRDKKYLQAVRYTRACGRLRVGASLPAGRLLGETLG